MDRKSVFPSTGRGEVTYACFGCGIGRLIEIQITADAPTTIQKHIKAARDLLEYGIGVNGRRIAALIDHIYPEGTYTIKIKHRGVAIIEPPEGAWNWTLRSLTKRRISVSRCELSPDRNTKQIHIVDQDASRQRSTSDSV